MEFTALHQALGSEKSPFSDEMIDDAVAQGIQESDALDWKRRLPEERKLAESDFAKDVAAMANSGGGVIVYGVAENGRSATERVDAGAMTEQYERTMRRVAVSNIHPPVFGLQIHSLGAEPRRAVVMVVPASVEGPHLVYRGEYFGAPVRNHADTEWMKERQLEAAYRARLEAHRRSSEELSDLYAELAAGPAVAERAWMFGVARPRTTLRAAHRTERAAAAELLQKADGAALADAAAGHIRPLSSVDLFNPRPGLRRWIAPSTVERDSSAWKEARASVHDDGTVSLAAAMGAMRTSNGADPAWLVRSMRAELFVADLMALVRAVGQARRADEYEVMIGLEWAGAEPVVIETTDQMGFVSSAAPVSLHAFTPVLASVRADLDPSAFRDQTCDLALDVVNQGGVQFLRVIKRLSDEVVR